MRILILAPRVPWPPRDGGRVAMSRLAESMAACGAEVEVLSLNPRRHRVTPNAPLPIEAIDVDTSRVVAPAVRALLDGIPYIVARFVSPRFRDALRAALRRFRPDVVQIESPFLLLYASLVRSESSARVVLRSLNVEFRIWEGLARIERRPFRRPALRRIAESLRRYELREMERLDAIVPISEGDAADFRALGVSRPMHVVPCSAAFAAGESTNAGVTVAFIGSLDYRPNQDAVAWIVDELWPRVAALAPEARLSIGGSSPPAWLRRKLGDVLADVENADDYLRDAAVVIAPLFAGGGMRVKVLDAMALGKAIVATTLGAGGIDVTNGGDIVLADDAETFAAEVVRLLRDPAAAARIGDAARATVAQRYDGEALARGLLRFYEDL
jgi:glycosyltransferase involved in cell wall biosynthesis